MKSIITTIILALSMFQVTAQEKVEVAKKDEKFVREAGYLGVMEVKFGMLAQTNASSAEVRTLAQNMITDHTALNTELKEVADRKNIYIPTELSLKQQKWYYKLSKKQGADFDKKYVKCVKKAHKKSICVYKKAAKKVKDPELKSWAAQKLPQLKHHLEMAENTCKMLK